MCGIAGLWERSGRADLGRLHQMSRLLRHRGPDDEGIVLLDPGNGQAFTLGGPDTPRDVYASPVPTPPAVTPARRRRPATPSDCCSGGSRSST